MSEHTTIKVNPPGLGSNLKYQMSFVLLIVFEIVLFGFLVLKFLAGGYLFYGLMLLLFVGSVIDLNKQTLKRMEGKTLRSSMSLSDDNILSITNHSLFGSTNTLSTHLDNIISSSFVYKNYTITLNVTYDRGQTFTGRFLLDGDYDKDSLTDIIAKLPNN